MRILGFDPLCPSGISPKYPFGSIWGRVNFWGVDVDDAECVLWGAIYEDLADDTKQDVSRCVVVFALEAGNQAF